MVVAAFRRRFEKIAAKTKLPKMSKSGLKKSKDIPHADIESHSLRRAIERSQKPSKEVLQGTEAVYAGGNTASNMRGVIRAEEKKFRERMGEKPGMKNVNKSSFYQ